MAKTIKKLKKRGEFSELLQRLLAEPAGHEQGNLQS